MPGRQRETLGKLFRSVKFFMQIECLFACIFNTLILSLEGFWLDLYITNRHATNALVLGNYLGVLASTVTLISWILVDDNSWLGKAMILFVVGTLLTSCGGYFTVEYLNNGNKFFTSENSTIIHNEMHGKGVDCVLWLPLLLGWNFTEGIITILFCVYFCLTMDK